MKKILTAILAIMLVAVASLTVMAQDITVTLNGEAINFADVKPQIIESRTMVPLRAIFEALEATVEWDDATKTAKSVKDDVTVAITIGDNKLIKNGEAVELDVPAQIIDSRTMVPVRAISESFGCDVDWDDATKTVIITQKPKETEILSVYYDIPTQTFDDDNAIGFFTETARQTLTVEADPADESNKALKITPIVEEKFWAYIWFDKFEYKAGKTYLFSADVMPVTDASGNTHESYTAGLCFRYMGKDNAILSSDQRNVPSEAWTHLEIEYTIPEDYVPADDDKLGVYFDPVDELGVSFYADNITVTLLDGDAQAPVEKPDEKPAEETKPAAPAADGKYTELPVQTIDDDNEIGFYTETARQTLTVEADPEDATNKVLKITPVVEEKFWAYIWFNNFQFEAGKTYKFSADVMPLCDASGNEYETFSAGLCFHYLGKDVGVLPPEMRIVPAKEWTHLEVEVEVPAEYVPADDDRIGVFFNPSEELGVSFLADNIAVEKLG